MILILSTPVDYTTNLVIDWLNFFGAKYKRVNGKDLNSNFKKYMFDINNGTSSLFEDISEVNVVWNRKFHNFSNIKKFTTNNIFKPNLALSLYNYYSREISVLFQHYKSILKDAYWLDDLDSIYVNKLDVLKAASDLSIKIPKTIIANNKDALERLLENFPHGLITKPIYEIKTFILENTMYTTNTQLVEFDSLVNIPDIFYPTLFQENLIKEYEIRTFYLEGNFSSMAIFSQDDSQTKVDFRKYNWKKMNRMVPYLLPDSLKDKLIELMKILNLKNGSIDLVKTNKGYVFLEVNPVGQFGMVSKPCNYFLEKKIAQKLIEYDRRKTKK